MSRRMNWIFESWAREVETYSIDKSFLDLSHFQRAERVELARDLRVTVLRWTGLPNCVRIGPTKRWRRPPTLWRSRIQRPEASST
jgi:DNA polymerase V